MAACRTTATAPFAPPLRAAAADADVHAASDAARAEVGLKQVLLRREMLLKRLQVLLYGAVNGVEPALLRQKKVKPGGGAPVAYGKPQILSPSVLAV